METEVRFAPTPHGARIAYTVEGAGKVVLIAPPTLAVEPLGVRQAWASCTAYSRKIEYDHAGSGLSASEPFDFTQGGLLAEMTAVADATADGTRCVLIGQWASGPTAISFAAEHPERVERLVLYNAWAEGAEYLGQPGWAEYRQLLEGDWHTATEAAARIALASNATGELAARFAGIIETNVDQPTYLSYLDAIALHDASQDLEKVSVPTSVLYTPDLFFPREESAHRLASEIPNATLSAAPSLQLSEPFALAVRSWILTDDGGGQENKRADEASDMTAADRAPLNPTGLSKREIEVARLIAEENLSNRQIAERLYLATSTVQRHVHNILQKTGLPNRVGIALYAYRAGFVSETDELQG